MTSREEAEGTKMTVTPGANDIAYVPVTFDRCDHIEGPFYHGTKVSLEVGDQLVPGHGSNFHQGRTSNNVYFSALVETAVWGAELAAALSGCGEREHIYVVEPTGPFEDDPNVTNKRFPGNITQSYRTRDPVRVVGEVQTWEGHTPEVLKGMLDNIARLREQGLDVIEDSDETCLPAPHGELSRDGFGTEPWSPPRTGRDPGERRPGER